MRTANGDEPRNNDGIRLPPPPGVCTRDGHGLGVVAGGPSDGAGVIDVCMCTHAPRLEILRRALSALANQSSGPGSFRLLLVDNATTPPLPEELLEPVRDAGIEARLVREERLGLTAARLRAIAETSGPWILFLDDDNELEA